MLAWTNRLWKKMLFRPTVLEPDHTFHFDADFEELWFDTPDGHRLNALYFYTNAPSRKGVVLYFHGNKDNLQRWGAQHRRFNDWGYDFFVPDYRGYGKSTGEPDEKPLLDDALMLYRWLARLFPPDQIVLYGRSLGSGVATFLASKVTARTLVLETPFDSINGLVASHVRRDSLPVKLPVHFPNLERLRHARMPVLVFHGTRDGVVPYASALRLKQSLKKGDFFVTIEGGSHNNLETFPQYEEYLKVWLEGG